MNPKQRAAYFTKLKNSKELDTKAAVTPTPHPKMLAPIAPKIPAVGNTDQVNPNYIGSGRAHKFKKIKQMFGL